MFNPSTHQGLFLQLPQDFSGTYVMVLPINFRKNPSAIYSGKFLAIVPIKSYGCLSKIYCRNHSENISKDDFESVYSPSQPSVVPRHAVFSRNRSRELSEKYLISTGKTCNCKVRNVAN